MNGIAKFCNLLPQTTGEVPALDVLSQVVCYSKWRDIRWSC